LAVEVFINREAIARNLPVYMYYPNQKKFYLLLRCKLCHTHLNFRKRDGIWVATTLNKTHLHERIFSKQLSANIRRDAFAEMDFEFPISIITGMSFETVQ